MKPRSQVTVALTGTSGSLMGLLVHRLLADSRVRCVVVIDPDSPAGLESGVRHYAVDVSQPGSEERVAEILDAEHVDTFVHLLLSNVVSRQPGLAHEIVTQGTLHALSACGQRSVRKLVLASTTMLYGAHPDNSPWLTEEHPLRADRTFQFLADRIEVEEAFSSFASRFPDRIVTILRIAPVLGPNTDSLHARYLSTPVVPVVAGFDPAVQFIHEVDAVRAFLMTIAEDHPGVFNIVSDAVVPLATAIRILGRAPVPVPEPLMPPVLDAMWTFRLAAMPAELVPYLKYPVLASGEKAAAAFAYSTSYPPVEVLGDLARALARRRLERAAGRQEPAP
jgi:UDP-glucose 4-epimerase